MTYRGVIATACMAVLALLLWGAYDLFRGPTYDTAHPDYNQLAQQMLEVEARLDAGSQGKIVMDLSGLNGGDWQTACLFGGYATPSATLSKLNAKVKDIDKVRFDELRGMGFRVTEVEEGEAMIAYVTADQVATVIHFWRGLGPQGQHFERCITKPQHSIEVTGENEPMQARR